MQWHALATWIRRWGIIVSLALSAISFRIASDVLDDSYDWVAHTTSEAAGQGVDGAWVARLGFLLFGLGVGLLSFGRHRPWLLLARALHGTFAVCMVLIATFSSRSWIEGSPYDTVENGLHSAAGTVMGFAFALGVVAVAMERAGEHHRVRYLDATAVIASIVLPFVMAWSDSSAGLLQRIMFLIAYAWYGRETWNSVPSTIWTVPPSRTSPKGIYDFH
jgi:hypothetical protein